MFQFKQFVIHQERAAMKVTTDGCLFGAWVAERLSSISKRNLKVLDVGAGTGLLSLMIAQKCREAQVDAIEMDPGSFEDCKSNFENAPWPGRLTAITGDANEFNGSGTYDIIVCNPPFYENEWKSPNPGRQLAHHGKGLKWNKLPTIIDKNLAPEGQFYLLLPWKRNTEAKDMLDANKFFISSWLLARQTPSHDYFRFLAECSRTDPLLSEFNEIIIKDNQGEYSAEFKKLLKDYYLYL